MKALAIILTCVFFASLIGFIITTAVTGVRWDNNFRIGWGSPVRLASTPHDATYNFTDSYSDIEISTTSARTAIKVSRDGNTRVEYKGDNPNLEFTAEIKGNALIIRERITATGGLWGWGWNWGWNSWTQGVLNIEIPEDFYNKTYISITSGKMSGELPYTDNLYLNVTSGNVNLDYNHGNAAHHLKSHTTSGTVTLNGFRPDTYDIYSTSGTQRISGLTGSGSVRLTSGTINVDFDEWNGSLSVNITSGRVNITAPSGSGADLNFSRTSGSMSYNMDGDSGRLSGRSTLSIGGANKQSVRIDMTSGSASITTR